MRGWCWAPPARAPWSGPATVRLTGRLPGRRPRLWRRSASVRWAVTDNFSVTFNVDNLLDELPPQTADGLFSQANTDPQVYDVLGRQFAISGRYRF